MLTQFTFGRQQTVLSYRHWIVSKGYRTQLETGTRDSSLTGPAFELSRGIGWIAIQWEYLLDGDVEEAAEAAVKQCGFFFRHHTKTVARSRTRENRFGISISHCRRRGDESFSLWS